MGFHDKWRRRWGFMINGGQGGYFMINGVRRWIFYDKCRTICLFVLRLNVPVNNFSVMSGRSHCFLGN